MTRGSAAVACRRFSGVHSYDKIAEMLEGINQEMGLSYRKIVATVSDNGSNFVKCFKEFGIKINLPDQENEEDDGHADADDEEDIGIVQFPDTPEEPSFKLPNHIRCASHTLNLVATTDAAKGLKEADISKLNNGKVFCLVGSCWQAKIFGNN